MTPEVSVVMPVYNSEEHLRESIESILNQTFEDFEFIIIDDCSQDKSKEIVKEYASRDDRIRLMENEENRGVAYSLNKGIENARSKYIARMDADDISHEQRLEKQYSFMEDNEEVVVLGTRAWNIDDEGNEVGERNVPETHEDVMNTIPLMSPMIHPSVMMRKEEIKEIGSYDKGLDNTQDYDLWFRCASQGYKLYNLQERLLYYRLEKGRSFRHRITSAKVRWKGCKRLGIPFYKRYGVLIALVLAVIPKPVTKKLYNSLTKLDPREKK